jgi:catechol 2,3-dioxygenase-like lactoylglutathione lyase family enzyme
MVTIRGLSPLLQVFDMPRAVEFYRDVLGFELVATSPKAADGHFDWCMLEQGGAVVMLNTAYERDQRPPASPARNGEGGMSLYFGCPDVDAAYAALRERVWPADPPRDNRPEPVGTDDYARPDALSQPGAMAHHHARNTAPLVEQLFDGRLFPHFRAGRASTFYQSLVQDPARHPQPRAAEGPHLRLAEAAEERRPTGRDDPGAIDRLCPGALQIGNDAQPVEEAHRLRAHVFGAGLLARECSAIEHQHPMPRTGEVSGGRAAGWAGARDDDVERHGWKVRGLPPEANRSPQGSR